MEEIYILKRTDTGQYYHSLTPLGDMLWIDQRDHAQWFSYEKLDAFIDRMNGQGNPKYDQLEKELA